MRIEPAWLAVLVFHRIGGDDALTRTDRANGADAAPAGADRVLRYKRRVNELSVPPGRAGFASGRTRTIERDTKGAKTRFIAPAYGKFESSSLQRGVNCEVADLMEI